MLLAQLPQPWGGLLAGAVALVFFSILGFFILKGYRWFTRASTSSQSRLFHNVTLSQRSAPGLVEVTFHTYTGLLVFTHQFEYHFWAPPADARTVLTRLHHHNLTRGFFAYGGFIIPLLSIGNYYAQSRRISKQESALPTPK